MHFDFDTPIDRRGTDSIKFDFAAEHGYDPDILPLWVADMDFQAPQCVIDALQARVAHGIFGYSDTKEDYFEAVRDWFSARFDLQLQPQWLIKTPGVVFALSAAVRVMTQPGDSVLVQPPVYYPFYKVVQQNGRRIVESPLVYANGKYTIDFDDFEEKIVQNGVKLFILCSPPQPGVPCVDGAGTAAAGQNLRKARCAGGGRRDPLRLHPARFYPHTVFEGLPPAGRAHAGVHRPQ